MSINRGDPIAAEEIKSELNEKCSKRWVRFLASTTLTKNTPYKFNIPSNYTDLSISIGVVNSAQVYGGMMIRLPLGTIDQPMYIPVYNNVNNSQAVGMCYLFYTNSTRELAASAGLIDMNIEIWAR